MATYFVVGENEALVPIRSSKMERYHVPVAADPFHLIARGNPTTVCGMELTDMNRSSADWDQLPLDVRCAACASSTEDAATSD